MTTHPRPEVDPRYELLELLGEGAVAVVWLARDTQSDQLVAIKVLQKAALKLEAIQRFAQEVTILSRLEHPAVVRIYDTGVAGDDSPYVVMEYIPGGTLRTLLAARGGAALDPTHAVAIISSLAEGLAAAHALQVVHRDVKPENVLVGREGAIKLVDFGMAKVLRRDSPMLTFGSKICGTPQYMAPERARGIPVSGAADVYSLAVIAYELLSGRRPFDSKHPVEVLMAHVSDPPPEMPSVPPELAQVVFRALDKDPDQRPSAAEFARLLRVARRC